MIEDLSHRVSGSNATGLLSVTVVKSGINEVGDAEEQRKPVIDGALSGVAIVVVADQHASNVAHEARERDNIGRQ